MPAAHSPNAAQIQAINMSMHFGDFVALDKVDLCVKPGSFHALLGENGAGKSTLVKCLMGFYQATEGDVLVDQKQVHIKDPKDAQDLGLGMVYQHFTLVPSLTAAENLVISRNNVPNRINWTNELHNLNDFLEKMPFRVPLQQPISRLSAGEKQKLEILKQLYLGSRFLILDEPTSVLTPQEADEVLGHVKSMTTASDISVLMITHKFREVSEFADEVSVLRRGKLSGNDLVSQLSHEDMARMMVGETTDKTTLQRQKWHGHRVLELENVLASDRSGLKTIEIDSLAVKAGEIVGIAGVSGNGQTELMEILTGARPLRSGIIKVNGEPFKATRREAKQHHVRYLPEEPLHNACAQRMSVAENLSFRIFDVAQDPNKNTQFWLDKKQITDNAEHLISEFNIKTISASSAISELSGGNVQRAVLARELSGDVNLLIISNPCFGLDFSAVAAIRERIMDARNNGVAVLIMSEDLDEVIELSDRILVMSDGQINYECQAADADIIKIGEYMAGHHV